MREILFKAKRKDNGEWVIGDYSHFPNNDVGIEYTHKFFGSGTKSRITIEVDPETICQYTGLLDKNGKKIFEGDIISILNKQDWKVVYECGQFITYGYKEEYIFEPLTLNTWKTECVEVIGNIFDNPELMGV